MQSTHARPRIFNRLAHGLRPRERVSVSQWADAHRVISRKQGAEAGPWRTDRNPLLREPMDAMGKPGDVVLMFPIQLGKALALDTPIPTPDGWTTMGALDPGSTVLGSDGRPTLVVAASEVFIDHACYRVSFSDGASVIADAGHRWAVVDMKTRAEDRKEVGRRAARGAGRAGRKELNESTAAHTRVLETQEISQTFSLRGQSRYAVKVAAPLDLPPAKLPLDPYLLGLWLGDGHTHYGAITTMDPEIVAAFAEFEPKPHTHQSGGKATTYGLRNGFGGLLRRIGVLKNKHIPPGYMRASMEQRLQLLRGLLDTDGYAETNGVVEITSSKPPLAAGIIELLRTLGFKPTARWRKTKGKDSCRITFTATRSAAVFSLPRKLIALPEKLSARGAEMPGLRYIVDVQPVESVPTRCIAVDSQDHLFLCGEGFVPTHNTEVLLNDIGYSMDRDPCPLMVCLPGEVSLNKWVAQKLQPMIDETPVVRRSLTSVASREAANTRTFKDFAGGQLYVEHAGSPSRLKSSTVRKLRVDELDEFAANLAGGDDPVEMLNGRTSAYPGQASRAYVSTPQLRSTSRIFWLWEQSDQRRYHVPCPHCGEMQPLVWPGLRWSSTQPRRAWYVCRECGAEIDEYAKPQMFAAGQWVPERPDARIRGYTANCLYYPLGLGPRWADMAERWLDAQGDPARLKTFINDRLAEPWEDKNTAHVRANLVQERAVPYPLRTAPQGVVRITAGVDTQDDRLEVHIVGWGAGRRWWVIDYAVLPGDPALPDVWAAAADLLNRPIEHASGALLQVEATSFDMLGHRTEHVKNFVRQRRVRRPMASYGAKANTAPVLSRAKLQDVTWRGQTDKRGVHVFQIGTVDAKHALFAQLAADHDAREKWLNLPDTDDKPAAPELQCHFSEDLPDEFFSGLVSEVYNPSKNRFEKRRGSVRNEPLDTWVHAYAATHHPELRLHRARVGDWERWEAALLQRAPKEGASEPVPTTPPAAARPAEKASAWHDYASRRARPGRGRR